MDLRWPSTEELPSYVHALERGWSPNTMDARAGIRELEALPPHVLGHVGYTVVPWKRRRGYATEALRLILADATAAGLRWIEVTTDPDNVASQRVIEANGGRLVERFDYPPAHGAGTGLRYRIDCRRGQTPDAIV